MSTQSNEDLPTALLAERDRVRDVVKPAYEEIGYSGQFALKLTIEPALHRADEALKNHDAVGMIRSLAELRDIEL